MFSNSVSNIAGTDCEIEKRPFRLRLPSIQKKRNGMQKKRRERQILVAKNGLNF